MTRAIEIITKAMQKAQVLRAREKPQGSEASDALDTLNDVLASWSAESLLIHARVTEPFALTPGVGHYTMGVGQTFNTTLPVNITDAYVRQETVDTPVRIISDVVYHDIPQKLTRGVPSMMYYNNAYPMAMVHVHPVPSGAYTLFVTSEKPLRQFALTDEVDLPPGWKRALIYNLAIELAPEYGKKVADSLYRVAVSSKAAIARPIIAHKNMDVPLARMDGFCITRGFG